MKHNFSAGPSILPQEVFAEASEAVRDFDGMGLSILEISHRSKQFSAVMDEAERLVRQLLQLTDDYAVLFLSGGASSQFFMTAMNLSGPTDVVCYLDTGTWSTKAIKEAQKLGNVEVVASSKDRNYSYIPKEYSVRSDARFFHITTNNTIYGTQLQRIPQVPVPLVADMSSDIFSQPLDPAPFGVIYAGAQKNLGPAGTTLVVVRKDLLGKTGRDLPTMLNYETHIAKGSMFNTPPVFPIYVSMLNMRWLIKNGGLEAAASRNRAKAELLYTEIDRNQLFKGTVDAEDRSRMNVTFVMEDDTLTAEFLELCTEAGINGLKGHRSVGGFRASMYNAMKIDSVQVLVELMQEFERRKG